MGYDPFIEQMKHRSSLRITVLPPVVVDADAERVAAVKRTASHVPNIFDPAWLATQPAEYRAGICRGRAYARRILADQTSNSEELRVHMAHAAEYEAQGQAS
jgi:hypothetical protein